MILRISKIVLVFLSIVLLVACLWHFSIRIFLGDYYYRQTMLASDWPDVLNFYQKVLFFQPSEPFYHQRFANDLRRALELYQDNELKLKTLDLAIDRMSRISEPDRSFSTKIYLARLYTSRAVLTQSEQDFSIAEQSMEKAAQMSPQMARVYNDWCQLKIYKEDWLAAEQMCKKAFYLYPDLDHPQMTYNHRILVMAELSQVYEKLGEIYLTLENYEKSESMYTQILKFFPLTRVDIWKRLGDVYYIQGNLDAAIKRNFHGHILRPKDPFWHLTLGLLYQEKGDLEQARFWGEKGLVLDSENQKIKAFLQSIY